MRRVQSTRPPARGTQPPTRPVPAPRQVTGILLAEQIFMPGAIEARLIEERKVTGLDFSDALETELTELGRQCGALGADGKLADLLA